MLREQTGTRETTRCNNKGRKGEGKKCEESRHCKKRARSEHSKSRK